MKEAIDIDVDIDSFCIAAVSCSSNGAMLGGVGLKLDSSIPLLCLLKNGESIVMSPIITVSLIWYHPHHRIKLNTWNQTPY